MHRGPIQTYAVASILQARASNPEESIVIITDLTELPLSLRYEDLKVVNFETLLGNAGRLDDYYKHDNPNPRWFTLGNLQRWRYIHDFVTTNSATWPILCLDSDSYLHASVSKLASVFAGDLSVLDGRGPQFTLFRDEATLANFCDFLEQCIDPKASLSRDYRGFLDAQGLHSCDMSVFGFSEKYFNVQDFGKESTTIMFVENPFSWPDEEKVSWGPLMSRKLGQSFLKFSNRGEVVFGGIHLQGKSKSLWPRFIGVGTLCRMFVLSPISVIMALFEFGGFVWRKAIIAPRA